MFFKERSILIYFASQYHVLLPDELKATDENDRLSNSKESNKSFLPKPIGAGS